MRNRSGLFKAAGAALVVLVGGATVGAPGASGATASAEWHTVASPNPQPYGFMGNSLDAVACPTVTRCFAVGSRSGKGLVLDLDHGKWQLDSATFGGGVAGLNTISCSSVDFCIALGDSQSGSRGLRFDGSSWSPLSHAPAADNGISCPSVGHCWAVGERPLGSAGAPLIERYQSGRWTVESLDIGAGADVEDVLSSVSCVSVVECWAVGANESGSQDASIIDGWDGHSWRSVVAPHVGKGNRLFGVSCVSAADCYAVGQVFVLPPPATSTSGVAQPPTAGPAFIEHYDGHSWRVVAKGFGGLGELTGIWCGRSSGCVAVGDGDIIEQTSGGWQKATVDGPSGAEVSAAACVVGQPKACYAVGEYSAGDTADSYAPLILQRS